MGNGCLKPTPRTGQIYIDCINKIYDEVKQLQIKQQQKTSSPTHVYQSIKQVLQKKGWLRKLIDNLTSHRQSISQAALHNFRLMTQSKGKQYKITGLIVIDYIITGVLRQSGLQVSDKFGGLVLKMVRDKEINAQSQYQQSQPNMMMRKQAIQQQQQGNNNDRIIKPLTPIQKGNNKIPSLGYIQQIKNNTNPNQQINSINNNNNNYQQSNKSTNSLLISNTNNPNNYSSLHTTTTQQPPLHTSMNSLLLRQIYNVKFSNIFYNMLHSLISTQDTIYVSAVKSIITYTRYHTVKNIQQQKIIDLLQILLQHIQTNQQVNLSLKAYQMLLNKLKQTFLQNQIKHFNIFLKIWQQSYQQTNNQQQHSKQQHFYIEIENKLLIENIIHKMIVSMIGSVGINKIYQQIIFVYDQHKFEGMVHFQEMLINITRKDQLKKQFYRGLYSFLLSYLAVCKGQGKGISSMKQLQLINNNNSDSNTTTTQTLFNQKWASIHSSKPYQSFIQQYENILDYKVKKSVISTLKRWSKQYQFVEINQIIKYNSQLVLNSFLFNIHECFVVMEQNNGEMMINVVVGNNNNINSNNNNNNNTNNNNNNNYSYSNPSPLSSSKTSPSPSLYQQFITYLSQQFCTQFCHPAHLQQRISITNLLFDQIKSIQQQITDNQKLLYLEMIEKLFYQQQIQSLTKHIDWCQLELGYSNQILKKLINLLIIIINKLTQKMLIKQIDHLAYFLYSIFDMFTKISTQKQHNQIIQILTLSIKLIQTIQRSNGSLIILAFTQRMVKAITNDLNKTNFYYTWDLIINCVYILLTSPRNSNRQMTKSHLNQIYIQLTINQQLKNNFSKYTQQQMDQKINKILLDTFGYQIQNNQLNNQFNNNQIEQQQIINIYLPKPQDFQKHHYQTGSHQKIYQLSSIAFRDMFNRGVSQVKGGFFPTHQQQVSFISQNGGFSRANSIIHQDDIKHQEKSIADVMDMIHF